MNVLQLTDEPTTTPFVRSCQLPREQEFRRFVADYVVPSRDVSVDEAAQFIKLCVGIDSRNALKTDRGAQQRFHEFLMKPFIAWRARQTETA
ncbi:hypothetical protein AWB78_01323 [Caballeronia calidae]|uniref:Uncharacterized protein n=1 Tax=Caballeronia calidae TaxID=1777139 RepID=A0A158A6T6_9BURK|nr:hypothetical protein [Caballeronia calidae]SAK53409.1 hypothetical protein AWB78_01323 [Caballeronia calidae]